MIAIISDIHGNYPALRAVLSDIDQLGIKRIISLGDVAGYYPMINECTEELIKREVLNLMGNHDYYLCSGHRCSRSNSANQMLEIQRRTIRKSNLEWLARSSLFHNEGRLSMVHGGWNNPIDEYLTELSSDYFAERPFDYFFCGHTHVQFLHEFEPGRFFCNPGSVGQPRDGNPDAAYATMYDGVIALHRIKYDISAIQQACVKQGIPDHQYKNLSGGTRIGGKLDQIAFQGKN